MGVWVPQPFRSQRHFKNSIQMELSADYIYIFLIFWQSHIIFFTYFWGQIIYFNPLMNQFIFMPPPRSGEGHIVLPLSVRTYVRPYIHTYVRHTLPGRVAQSVGHLTRKSEVLGSNPGLATYFRFSFRWFKKGSCQLLAKVCALSTG